MLSVTNLVRDGIIGSNCPATRHHRAHHWCAPNWWAFDLAANQAERAFLAEQIADHTPRA